jgi:hypothetical protein
MNCTNFTISCNSYGRLDILNAWIKFTPRKILYSTFDGERLVGKPKKKKKKRYSEAVEDTGHKKLAKMCDGETRVEKLHTRGQGPEKEEERDFVAMGMNYRVPFIRWKRERKNHVVTLMANSNRPALTARTV